MCFTWRICLIGYHIVFLLTTYPCDYVGLYLLFVQKLTDVCCQFNVIHLYFSSFLKVNMTDTAALREARLSDAEAELSRSKAACARLLQVTLMLYFLSQLAAIVFKYLFVTSSWKLFCKRILCASLLSRLFRFQTSFASTYFRV